MRKTVKVMVVAVLLVALTCGAVLAKTINGTANDDYLEGTPKADNISGRAGDDHIHGLAGADELVGGRGKDTVWGDLGDDKIYGWAGNDTLIGWRGYDRLVGGNGADGLVDGEEMFGGDGNDRIGDAVWDQPQPGSFQASGGGGDDVINATDNHLEIQDGISTPDTVECGPGFDDRVMAEAEDTVADDCEHVRIIEH